ncbi:hypothetical protein CSKR_110984 [Clonorchis sinensis]|uniref:Uncharacterized protein n=1 Tax=Clonorchis sinensis TaxID=79923 RepID=A0A3R7FHC9_CLOSI|nr:hypothetical protein CSKR_110984 [Clonorchis sinensis]
MSPRLVMKRLQSNYPARRTDQQSKTRLLGRSMDLQSKGINESHVNVLCICRNQFNTDFDKYSHLHNNLVFDRRQLILSFMAIRFSSMYCTRPPPISDRSPILKDHAAEASWEPTNRKASHASTEKLVGSNPCVQCQGEREPDSRYASRRLLSRLWQPGSISALKPPSGGMAAMHRKGATAERLFIIFMLEWVPKRTSLISRRCEKFSKVTHADV